MAALGNLLENSRWMLEAVLLSLSLILLNKRYKHVQSHQITKLGVNQDYHWLHTSSIQKYQDIASSIQNKVLCNINARATGQAGYI